MKDDNIGHDEISLLLLKLVTGGQATDAEVAALGPLAAPKVPRGDAPLVVPDARTKKGW